MTKVYVIEKTLEIVIDGDDFAVAEVEPSEDAALEIAREIDNSEWQQVDIIVVGVQ